MHIRKLLHKTFKDTSDFIDKRNHNTLLEAVVTLSVCKHLSIAALENHGVKTLHFTIEFINRVIS